MQRIAAVLLPVLWLIAQSDRPVFAAKPDPVRRVRGVRPQGGDIKNGLRSAYGDDPADKTKHNQTQWLIVRQQLLECGRQPARQRLRRLPARVGAGRLAGRRRHQEPAPPGSDVKLDRSQGDIGLFVPDAGYPFGDIPHWLIRQRAHRPAASQGGAR